MTLTRKAAIVVTCDQCGQQSRPLNEAEAEIWERQHTEHHARIDLQERMAERGHVIQVITDYVTNDDQHQHATCSCGWASRPFLKFAIDSALEHLADAEAEQDAEDVAT